MSTRQIVYWAHSYKGNIDLDQHFAGIVRAANVAINLDPPSDKLNDAKLSQNLRNCDGMVALLTWRDNGPSQYILYEIGLALRARKPVLVFLDDRLPEGTIPDWIFQQRYSSRTYFQQAREQTDALHTLKGYIGDPPPARYGSNSGQRACGIVGLKSLDRANQNAVRQFLEKRRYRWVTLENVDISNPLVFDKFGYLARLNVALQFVDARERRSMYWGNLLSIAAIPLITLTTNPEYPFSKAFPKEFQPCIAQVGSAASLEEKLTEQFDVYEQEFLEALDAAAIKRYTNLLVQARSLDGHYEPDTRNQFTDAISSRPDVPPDQPRTIQ